jgi:proto-oncogene tyrosine-protein kinase Ret
MIVVACVVPFIVALLLITLLIIWQKAQARRPDRTASREHIADEDMGRHTDSTNGSRNDSGIDIIIEEVNTIARDTVEPQLRSQFHNKPVNAKYLEPDMLYESHRGRTAWVLPPLLGIEQEFPRDQLCFIKELGIGKFSKLMQGEAMTLIDECPVSSTVLVKVIAETASESQVKAFKNEITRMAKLQHSNVLEISAVCTTTYPFSIIYSLDDYVSLKQYLITAAACNEPDFDSSFLSRNSTGPLFTELLISSDLLSICHQIAAGMKYLSGENFVHKDLATRNCLAGNGMQVKITTYGIPLQEYSSDYVSLDRLRRGSNKSTTSRYSKIRSTSVPLRWMAPESLQNHIFTTESDVWSFGILMWEVFSLGGQPYSLLTDEEVLEQVSWHGHTIDSPPKCPPEIHALMTKCWRQTPESRPTFTELYNTMEKWVKDGRFTDYSSSSL